MPKSSRRTFLSLIAALTASPARAAEPGHSRVTAYAFGFARLGGGEIRLGDYAGKPILVVNTASQCGFTPQYTGLEAVWARFGPRGLTVIGVPSNDFGGQEPGGAVEIGETTKAHGVTFPIAEKAAVTGDHRHPFYRWAAQERPLELPRWNFHKYLIGRDGHVAGVFASAVEPLDPRLVGVIERELAGVSPRS